MKYLLTETDYFVALKGSTVSIQRKAGIKRIVTCNATYAPEPSKMLRLSNDILKHIENDMEVGKPVEFKIDVGDENFDLSFQNNVFLVSTKRNKEIEEEIAKKIKEEIKREKPSICSSFPQRVGIDI